jgi:hypothetical protein
MQREEWVNFADRAEAVRVSEYHGNEDRYKGRPVRDWIDADGVRHAGAPPKPQKKKSSKKDSDDATEEGA